MGGGTFLHTHSLRFSMFSSYFFLIFSLSLYVPLFYMTLVRAANRSKTAQRGVKTNQFFSFQLKLKRWILLYSRTTVYKC